MEILGISYRMVIVGEGGREGKETNRCYRAPIINANHFSKACLIFKHAAMKPLSREQAEG